MWKIRPHDKDREQQFVDKGANRLLARLLSQRDIPVEGYEKFVAREYNDISHPYNIHDMEKAVEIFTEAVVNKKKIAVLGDYDCDGVVSCVMFKELCRALDYDCDVFLPSRLLHNYGLSGKSAKAFKERHQDDIPYAVFLLDCGSNNFEEIEDLRKMGVEKVVVIDHHLISKEKGSFNADCFVNWHLSEDKQEMCTCGLMLQFVRGVRWKTKKVNTISFLTYAAIGTIADMSPIIGDNRLIVRNGLTKFALDNVPSAGLHSLLTVMAKKNKTILSKGYLTQEDVTFQIGPRINAVGRINHPDIVYGLLIDTDPGSADKIAEYVNSFNEERKDIQKSAEIEAIQRINENDYKHGIFVCDQSWHIGVAGIVASRLVEEFNKPTIVVGQYEGVWRGSGRSVMGVNVKEILDDCSEMFIAYGGHEAACGVTLKPEYVDRANEMFNAACKRYYAKYNVKIEQCEYYDAALQIGAINDENANLLADNLAPYCGELNPEPVFLLKDAIITDPEIKTFQNGKYSLLKLKVSKDGKTLDYPFISFQLAKRFGNELQGRKMDVYFKFPQSPDSRFELQLVDLVERS